MDSNPLVELQELGQSIWYDNIRRSLILSGDLQAKIEEDGLRGVTSNPAIFEKAIGGSTDYNESLNQLVKQGKDVQEIYATLVIDDIRMAADLLRPVYERTNGLDGYVSLEVSPSLAHKTEETVEEARWLWEQLDRKNVMIKVPATPEGLPAIEQLISEGININVTLIFSQKTYEKVAEAFISGLEKRAAESELIDHVASVASFFVSRIDTAVDNALEFRIRRSSNEAEKARLSRLLGKVAIANARLAYQRFKSIFGTDRFQALEAKGAHAQRVLWASTGTKNPNCSDVLYVEELIGADTVNTVPPATYTTFRDHGRVSPTLEEDLDDARRTLDSLAEAGIDLDHVTDELLAAGVKGFVEPFDKLINTIEKKRQAILTSIVENQSVSLGKYKEAVLKTLKRMDEERYVCRLWRKDATLWKQDPKHQKIVRNSLGWLRAAETLLDSADELKGFARRVCEDGFEYVMLLGMGGSSLCPEVLRRSFGKIEGFPQLLVLDSTDPATVKNMQEAVNISKTLFLVASKSGTTTEPLMFYRYFFDKVAGVKPDRPGGNFVAITDPGTKLEQIARERGFRRIFQNMTDIGGRYSALSFFGMVPAALMGLDVKEILEQATVSCEACEECVPTRDNPGAHLGAILAELARQGRDKVTLIIAPPIDSLGLWIEQLIAESTGKEGQGILPVAGEPLGKPSVYGDDRLFVYIRTADVADKDTETKLKALEAAGHPVIRHVMPDALNLGYQFFLWELATALAGALTNINAFDQPNVQESKDNTKRLLELYRKEDKLPEQEMLVESEGCRIYGDANTKTVFQLQEHTLGAYVGAHLARAQRGDYVALTAYIPETSAHDQLLNEIRTRIRDTLKTATTVGYGPRFLHSTGQLHKGGAGNGLFIQITADDRADLAIPDEPYTFGILKEAQALGDFQSLSRRNRRAIRFHLGGEIKAGLKKLLIKVQEAVEGIAGKA